ncbi:MAG TPA: phosphoglycerate kinase [Desulfobacteraceae bacterium]|nr:phosphoglycerate kinase [Desulfobacteraceae bacterium]
MESRIDPRVKLMQDADMRGKVVLLRVDHNVVKNGEIKDPYRIDATLGTLYAVAEKGGRPILMTHVGRPRDKKTGAIFCREQESVEPIVRYLERKLPVRIHMPTLPVQGDLGIVDIQDHLKPAVKDLVEGRVNMVYLPNTRWFRGEEETGGERIDFARQLASLADIYINDAFGSWQPHASTYDVAELLPSFAGILLQRELAHLNLVLSPEKPFTAVVAGAKYDTKIGPLKALHAKVDHLVLGGLMYNAYLSAKYNIEISGVTHEDKKAAGELVEMDREVHKIVELDPVVESDTLDGRNEGEYRTVSLKELSAKKRCGYVVDISPEAFDTASVSEAFSRVRTLFANAVMGLMPFFPEGSRALYKRITASTGAGKLLGGGDTLQEFKNLCPGEYMKGLDSAETYYFTGGGSVLTAIEQGTAYGLKPVQALMKEQPGS